MEKGIYIKDMAPNESVNGIFAIKSATLSDSRNGSFWKLELFDRTGIIIAMIWAPLSQKYENLEAGMFVAASGQCKLWREKMQLVIKDLTPLSQPADLDLLDFMPASPWDIDEMEARLREAARKEFTYGPWRKLTGNVLDDSEIHENFRTFPAARSIHQAYAGGLLEHSLAVFSICQCFCDLYPYLDRQTLLAAALLHDIGKIREFTGGLFNEYTTEGSLAGHIYLGLEMLSPFLAKSGLPGHLKEHFIHLVLSHHGQREFGAPVLPQTPEAFALHTADLADARLSQCRQLFHSTGQEKGSWSAWQSSLERRIFNPQGTPVATSSHPARKMEAQQGSLLFEAEMDADAGIGGVEKE